MTTRSDIISRLRNEFCDIATGVAKGDRSYPPVARSFDEQTLSLIVFWLDSESLLMTHSLLQTESSPPLYSDENARQGPQDIEDNEILQERHLHLKLRRVLENAGVMRETRTKFLAYRYMQLLRQSQLRSKRKPKNEKFDLIFSMVKAWLQQQGLQHSHNLLVREVKLEFGIEPVETTVNLEKVIKSYATDVGLYPETLDDLV